MDLVYRKANINDIDDLVDFKIKQNMFTCNREGITLENEDIARKNIKNVLFLNGKKAYITSVYTDEDYRRNGIQNKLMNMVLDLLKELDCRKIELDAVNPNAIKLYEKFGFKRDDEKFILKN